uniref:Lipoate protein ligase-like protein n=1 Tax=Tetraselmis sp. GSL018 TaxID=582737 RepID=A0A061RLH3_9CHLO
MPMGLPNPPTLNLLHLRRFPLVKQLKLEEALLRADHRNWCILNDGLDDPTIVLGISGKPEELVHIDAARNAGVPMIKRSSPTRTQSCAR